MYTYKAKIVNVIDGDTVDAQVDLGFNIQANVRLRFAGINTAELRSNDPKAQEAKQFVIDNLLNKNVFVETSKGDKYGRWLATIYINETTINNLLLENGLAVKY